MNARKLFALAVVAALALVFMAGLLAQDSGKEKLTWDQSKSVYNRRIRPAEPAEKIDWDGRITRLLREEPGDIIVTAVGDMIFNKQISRLSAPQHRNLLRLMQEADIAYGNLEFTITDHPELQRPFYNFGVPREFAWELAAIGINLVSMTNNHTLDFGQEGLKDCLRALDQSGITHSGAGLTLAAAHSAGTMKVQSRKTRFGLLSYLRDWTPRFRSTDPSAPSLASIDAAVILAAKPDGTVEAIEGPLEKDVKTMEDDITLAKRHNDIALVSIHIHDLSHHRAYGIQDTTPANDEITFRRAIDAGADFVIGSGPHVLRGIEIYKGKPIFYSLSNFIYQYRTPEKIPVDLIHQRDGEVERPANGSVWDRRDHPRTFEGLMLRLTINGEKLRRVELIPVTIDDEGPLYGVPRLASDLRGREIIDRLQKLCKPYGTAIVSKGWYAEVVL